MGIMLMPAIAFGAYDSVTLTTSAIISINNSAGDAVSLTVSGDSSVIETISVGASSFSVTLQSGSSITVASAGRNLITTNAPDINETISCGTSQSSITLTATSEVTASVSVSPNACGSSSGSSSSSGGNGPVVSSGGGGGGTYIAPVITTGANTTSELQSQITSLLGTVASLQSQLGGASISSGGSTSFTKSLTLGSRGTDVSRLQKVLNSDSETKVSVSGAGSPGKETTLFGPATKKAIQKFQVKYGIASPGGVGYGVFGPKTRAKATEVAKSKGL